MKLLPLADADLFGDDDFGSFNTLQRNLGRSMLYSGSNAQGAYHGLYTGLETPMSMLFDATIGAQRDMLGVE